MTRDAVAAIKRATDLASLLDALRAFEATIDGIDIASLPTFGGPQPDDTDGVWSWDADSLLIGDGGFAEWSIVERDRLRPCNDGIAKPPRSPGVTPMDAYARLEPTGRTIEWL